ncbi:BRO family protein [Avibacterium avium]|uniref:BRO family protein n=1 Tax=Avibacterium avium TaxID=751 RepID=UPI003BF91DA8
MKTQIQFNTFNFHSYSIHVIKDLNQEIWFCGPDVCDILGYSNSRKTLQNLCKPAGVMQCCINPTSGRKEEIFINEPNLYRLIINSRKPEADTFETWVFEEVLPRIRKTGKYSLEQQQLALLKPEKKYIFEFTEDTCLCFVSMWFAIYNSLELLQQLHQPLSNLGSRFGSTAYTHYTEYQTILGIMKSVLEPMTEEFNPDPYEEAHYFKSLETLRSYQLKGLVRLVNNPTPPTRKYDV